MKIQELERYAKEVNENISKMQSEAEYIKTYFYAKDNEGNRISLVDALNKNTSCGTSIVNIANSYNIKISFDDIYSNIENDINSLENRVDSVIALNNKEIEILNNLIKITNARQLRNTEYEYKNRDKEYCEKVRKAVLKVTELNEKYKNNILNKNYMNEIDEEIIKAVTSNYSLNELKEEKENLKNKTSYSLKNELSKEKYINAIERKIANKKSSIDFDCDRSINIFDYAKNINGVDCMVSRTQNIYQYANQARNAYINNNYKLEIEKCLEATTNKCEIKLNNSYSQLNEKQKEYNLSKLQLMRNFYRSDYSAVNKDFKTANEFDKEIKNTYRENKEINKNSTLNSLEFVNNYVDSRETELRKTYLKDLKSKQRIDKVKQFFGIKSTTKTR